MTFLAMISFDIKGVGCFLSSSKGSNLLTLKTCSEGCISFHRSTNAAVGDVRALVHRGITGLSSAPGRLRSWARTLKRDIVALWLATRDPRVPWYAKLFAAVVSAYALSPIDLIPDFIPIIGHLDDLLLVPAGIWLTIKLIPEPILKELRLIATQRERPTSMGGMALIINVWIGALIMINVLLWPMIWSATNGS